ncbi:neurogenic locus notch homolog protein 1-like [Clytia hemisphaerica]
MILARNKKNALTTEIVCRNGYTGKYCDALVDNCAAANCGNGQCINKFNDYTCTCHDGYTGKNCETKIKNESCPYDDCDRTQCDKRCNIPKCNYDAYLCTFNLDPFKQCDIQECKNAINGTCRSDCDNMNCLYDSGNCIKPKKCSLEEQCKKAYGDGVCHPLCNTVDCGFDIDCISEPNLIPGSLVLEIDSTEGEFKAKKSQFEFELSRQLNSLVTVKSVRTLNAGFKRKRRSISNNTSPRLEVTMKMDNSKCVSQCFSTEQAARFLALKSANDDLRLPVRVVKVSSKPSGEPPITPSISPLWIALIVVGAVCAIGVIYGAKTVKTRFWKPEETTGPGKRETPIGQEELQILDESRDSKRQKLGFDHSEPFLNGMTDMNGMNGMHGLNINNMNNMNIGMIPNDTIDQQQHHDNPLHYAAHHGIIHILRTQMDYVDVNKRDNTGRTALHVATSTGNDDIFAHLIRNRSINPDIQDDEGETPLMVAVRMAGIEYVRQLVNLGSRTGLANKSGKTALHIAAMVDNYAAANILLAHSAKVDAQDNQMRTPLYLACTEDAYRTAALLVRHCANKSAADVDDITPLMVAQRKANHDIIRLFEANSPPHLMIPSPVSSNSTEMSPIYPDIRPKTHHMTTNQNHQNNRKRKKPNVTTTYNMDPLRAMPEWSNPLNQTNQFTINHQQQTFPFNGGSPFDTPSPYIVRQAELSPFSDTIPDIMTPPLSWTTSPNSEHEECG